MGTAGTLAPKTGVVSEPLLQLETIRSSLSGSRGPDQKRIAEEGVRWLVLMLRKNADYGSSAWKRPVLAPHLAARSAILVRMSDKAERIGQLQSKEPEVVTESLEDTVRDIGSYALLWLTCPQDQGREEKGD